MCCFVATSINDFVGFQDENEGEVQDQSTVELSSKCLTEAVDLTNMSPLPALPTSQGTDDEQFNDPLV